MTSAGLATAGMRPPATKPIEPAVPVSRVEGRTKITYAPPPLNTQPPSGQLPPPPVGRGGGQNHSNPSANSTPPHAAVKQELTGPGPGSRSSSERANNQSSSSDSSSSSSSSSDGSDRSRSPGRYAGNGDRDVRRTGMYNSPSPPADARRWLESRRISRSPPPSRRPIGVSYSPPPGPPQQQHHQQQLQQPSYALNPHLRRRPDSRSRSRSPLYRRDQYLGGSSPPGGPGSAYLAGRVGGPAASSGPGGLLNIPQWLIQCRLPPTVRAHFESLYLRKLRHMDLDGLACAEYLETLTTAGCMQVHDELASLDLFRIRNLTAFFIGLCNKYTTPRQPPPPGRPLRGAGSPPPPSMYGRANSYYLNPPGIGSTANINLGMSAAMGAASTGGRYSPPPTRRHISPPVSQYSPPARYSSRASRSPPPRYGPLSRQGGVAGMQQQHRHGSPSPPPAGRGYHGVGIGGGGVYRGGMRSFPMYDGRGGGRDNEGDGFGLAGLRYSRSSPRYSPSPPPEGLRRRPPSRSRSPLRYRVRRSSPSPPPPPIPGPPSRRGVTAAGAALATGVQAQVLPPPPLLQGRQRSSGMLTSAPSHSQQHQSSSGEGGGGGAQRSPVRGRPASSPAVKGSSPSVKGSSPAGKGASKSRSGQESLLPTPPSSSSRILTASSAQIANPLQTAPKQRTTIKAENINPSTSIKAEASLLSAPPLSSSASNAPPASSAALGARHPSQQEPEGSSTLLQRQRSSASAPVLPPPPQSHRPSPVPGSAPAQTPAAAPAVVHAASTDRHQQAAQPALSAAGKAEKGVHSLQTAASVAAQVQTQTSQKRCLSPSRRGGEEPPADPRVHLADELSQRAATLLGQQPVCLTGMDPLENAASAAVACTSGKTSPAAAAIAGVVVVGVDPASAIFAPQHLIDARCFALPQDAVGQTWEPPAPHIGLVSTPPPPQLGSNPVWSQSGSLDPAMLESSALRQSLTDLVKEVMKPAWRANRLSREMFKSLAKTAVDRILCTLPNGGINSAYDSPAGAVQFLSDVRKNKIQELVQGWVAQSSDLQTLLNLNM